MKQTLVIGSTVVDVIVEIPHLPITGEDVHIKKQSRSLGGCAFLVSDILRHFQAANSLCTAVGGGIYGDYVRKHLEQRGVPIYVSRPQQENGCCYCLVERSGERTFLSVHGIEYSFHAEYMDAFAGERFDYTYICGLEVEETTGGELVAWLEAHPDIAGTVVYAPGPRGIEVDTDRTERILGLHPILHLNEQEAQALAGMSGSEDRVLAAAQVLHAKTGNMVIVTRGADGVLWISADGSVHSAPSVPSTVVDTIGAGDSHCGAVLTGLTLGWTEEDTMRFANQIASEVVAQEGGAYIRR